MVFLLFPSTLQPVPEEQQNGPGFGYVVAFRPHGATGWMQAAVPSAEASRYVFKNESIQPFSPFLVKVGVYNNEGEGPFGPVTTINSAEEGVCVLNVTHTLDESPPLESVPRAVWSKRSAIGASRRLPLKPPSLCCSKERNSFENRICCLRFEGSSKPGATSECLCLNSRTGPSSHQGPRQEPLCIRGGSVVESFALERQ